MSLNHKIVFQPSHSLESVDILRETGMSDVPLIPVLDGEFQHVRVATHTDLRIPLSCSIRKK